MLTRGRRAGAVAPPAGRAPTLDSEARVWPVPLCRSCCARPGQARPRRGHGDRKRQLPLAALAVPPAGICGPSEVPYLDLTVISGWR